MEQFVMQVDEEYNPPSGSSNSRAAYHENMAVATLQQKPALNDQSQQVVRSNNYHNISRYSLKTQVKPRRKYRVTYVFQNEDDDDLVE